ncbi:hypothetical protein C7M84_016411 [Penaeus vannamei]|uniref:Uncharacterized protein n=1 Tax=Penaeus vannamei TaxID=6689 RepID=A0A423SMY4_PENVA|nr:hypothetical protein C7M84_016411 [Penaeus vannamei]
MATKTQDLQYGPPNLHGLRRPQDLLTSQYGLRRPQDQLTSPYGPRRTQDAQDLLTPHTGLQGPRYQLYRPLQMPIQYLGVTKFVLMLNRTTTAAMKRRRTSVQPRPAIAQWIDVEMCRREVEKQPRTSDHSSTTGSFSSGRRLRGGLDPPS